jgi:hypothetical protein
LKVSILIRSHAASKHPLGKLPSEPNSRCETVTRRRPIRIEPESPVNQSSTFLGAIAPECKAQPCGCESNSIVAPKLGCTNTLPKLHNLWIDDFTSGGLEGGVAFRSYPLDLDGTANSINDTVKAYQYPVAHDLDDTAMMLRKIGVCDFCPKMFQPSESARFVGFRKARIANDIGCQDC